jgi:uncharacterized protein YecE (DUF72 family)
MGELLIGTSGYDYPDWKGGFYPDKLARTKFLEYYSEHFNSLELNGAYYRMPTPEQMRKMIDKSGGRVRFSVKAFQDLTHSSYADAYAEKGNYKILIYEFKKALEPLLNSGLLVCALFQFPQSFHYEKEERLYLDLLLKEISDVPVVVEMRNAGWQNDQVYNALRERNTGWCITDSPNLKNLLKLDYVRTSDIAYMRFHGRNSEMWYKGDNVSRYDYMYSDAELRSFVNPILELLKHTGIVQLFFNNHAKSQAVVNAKKIEMLLKEIGKEIQ